MFQDWYDPIPYRESIEEALDILKEDLPRALVQVVAMFDITPLPDMSTGIDCDILHR